MSSEDAPPVSLVTSIIPFLPTYVHLVVAALFPIYAASHSSLRRPLNTLSPKQLKALRLSKSSSTSISDDGSVDEHESSSHMEQLTASDAMMFPVTAGAVLGGLYLLIKYLDDPTLLSRVLTWYFCAMGVFAIGKLFADGLGVIVGFAFPHRIRNHRGQLFLASYDCWKVRGEDTEIAAPIPRIQVPTFLNSAIWSARRTLRARWILHLKTGGEPIRKPFWIGDLVGPVIGTVVVGIYAVGGKHWLLTNIMGMSFSYGAMQLLSPTTFPIATLLLGLLFAYDIFFVFYTPLMITVATNLDVPIKLLFPRPGTTSTGEPALAMLGLGDIVIPGLVVAMALRWDLWRFYEQQRQALLRVSLDGKDNLSDDQKKELTKSLKPRYTRVTGLWGAQFWDPETSGYFPKTYFKASLAGYTLGMLTTLGVMHVFSHAQPALLYLVPGVLISIWGTAAVKGEATMLWHYTEDDGEDDEKKHEKEDKKEDRKGAVRGEVPETVLHLAIVRKPAVGAERSVVVTPPLKKSMVESESDRSGESDEVVVEKEGEVEVEAEEEMWGTTIIGAGGVGCA